MRLTSELLIAAACVFVMPMAVANSAGSEAVAVAGSVAADASAPATAAATVAADTLAAAGAALARDKNCLACHQIDSRRVGPPFASVARRYAPAGGLRDYLAQSIRQGGRGKWGAVPMPAQPQVSEQEANQLADWILALPISAQPK